MILGEEVLCKEAKKCELEALQKTKLVPESISALEELLHDVYVSLRPKQSDYQHRRDLIGVFNDIATKIYGNRNGFPVVEEFGSFLMDIFTSYSDLDLSVNFSENAAEFPRQKKIQTLRNFSRQFYALRSKGQVSSVNPILSAKVPILKVIDSGTGVECDLSIENRDGISKSQIIHRISSIDERFPKLCFLMKAWAKAHDINSSRCNTLNSLSIVLLVAFHLQTQDPPILPPFSAIFKDGIDPATVLKEVSNFLNYGSRNKESLAELFVTLLVKLSSVEKLWPKGLCASTFQGSWVSLKSKVGCIRVEDFLDRSQNVARAVGTAQAKKINKCIEISIKHVFDFVNGQIQGPDLRDFLFARDTKIIDKKVARPRIPLHPIKAVNMRAAELVGAPKQAAASTKTKRKRKRAPDGWRGTHQVMPLDHMLTKRMRPTEGGEGLPIVGWVGMQPPTVGWGGMHQPTVSWGGMLQPLNIHQFFPAPIFYSSPQFPFYDRSHSNQVVLMPYIQRGHAGHLRNSPNHPYGTS